MKQTQLIHLSRRLLAFLFALVFLIPLLAMSELVNAADATYTVDPADMTTISVTKAGVDDATPVTGEITVQGITLSETYIFTVAAQNEFALINSSGFNIKPTEIEYYSGYTLPRPWQKNKNLVTDIDNGSFLKQAVISESELQSLGYTSFKAGCYTYYYVVIQGTTNFAILIQVDSFKNFSVTRNGVTGVDSTEKVITVLEKSISKTYFLTVADYYSFSLINSSGYNINATQYLYYSGTNNRKPWAKGKNLVTEIDNGSFLQQATITENDLENIGYTTHRKGCHSYFFVVISIPNYDNYAILIQCKYPPIKADTTELEAAIAAVPTSGFYTENDRYNGRTTSENGFWADMETKLTAARSVLGNAAAKQAEVDAAAEALTSAIGNLISDDELNATELYEVVTAEQQENRDENNFTATSWKTYSDALSAAESYLNDLFDENGKATDLNKAANQDTANENADDLANAAGQLYYLSAQEQNQNKLVRLQKLMSALIALVEQAKEADYTADSWADFSEKLTAAKTAAVPTLSNTIADTASIEAYSAIYEELYHAFYWDLIPNGEITVTIQSLDPVMARYQSDIMSPYGTESRGGLLQKVSLSGDYTLKSLIASLDLNRVYNSNNPNNASGRRILVNGVFITEKYPVAADSRLGVENAWNTNENIRLHPGDRIDLIWRVLPNSAMGPTVNYTNATLYQYEDSLCAMRFFEGDDAVSSVEVHAGEAFSLALKKTAAALINGGDYTPAAEMTLFRSEVLSANEGNHPTPTMLMLDGQPLMTDEDGMVTLTLYDEGWFLLTAYDLAEDILGDNFNNKMTPGEYHSMNFGAAVWIHVLPAEDAETVKTELKDALKALRDTYPESIFAETDWNSLCALCDEALTDIDEAADISTARSKQQEAIKAIQTIQEKMLRENEEKPAAFRAALAQMPEDPLLLTAAQQAQVETLIAAYDALTPYQLSLLTENEISRYEEIKALYDAGLGASTSYTLTLAVTADTAEATAAAQALTEWLRANPATADQVGSTPAMNLKEYGVFYNDGILGNDPTSAEPLEQVSIVTSLNYALWFHLRNATGHTLSGEGWEVSDPDVTLTSSNRSLANDVMGSVTVLFGGVEYEVKSISVEGVDDAELLWSTASCLDTSTYKGKKASDVNLYFEDSCMEFSMPYRNVTVTVEWQPVSLAAKLEAAYSKYSKTNYTSKNWDLLTAAYEKGKTDIASAENADAANAALAQALLAMAAIEERDLTDPDQLGFVYVTVKNETGKKADGAAWEGVPVNHVSIRLKPDSTMMSCISEALAEHVVVGAERGYITSIDGLAAYSCGNKSGWMGTLNDWFTNEGFKEYSVANGKLHDGDEICVEYTCELGLDIRGGIETNHDTTLYQLTLSDGTLSPGFDSAVTEYVFTLKSGVTGTKIEFTNNNRSFQSRAYLNIYSPAANNWIHSGDIVKVSGGDVIYVGVGESEWPAMGTGMPTKYKITVISRNDASAVVQLISAIGSVTYENYQDKQAAVEMAKTAYEALTETAKGNVSNYATLEAAEKAIKGFQAVERLKAEIAKLPASVEGTQEDRAAVESARAVYAEILDLDDSFLAHLNVSEDRKYHKADNNMTLIDAVAKITDKLAAGIDFKHTEVENKKEMVRSALVDWFAENTSLPKEGIDVDPASLAFTEASRDKDGNYRAEVTLTCGGGAAAAIRTLTVEGKIIYVVSSEAGVTWIEIDGIRATPSKETENVWEASMPYGTDLKSITANSFDVELKDEKANVEVTKDETVSDGSKWIITVTAEDGTTTQTHIVTLTVSNVKVTVLDSWVYYVSDDVEPVKLDASAVVGLQKAVNPDKLGLDKGTTEAFLWLEARQKSNDVFAITPVYAPVGKDGKADPADFFNGKITLTLPVSGTEYAKVLFDGAYLDAKGSASSITFEVEKAGDYTLIPDARITAVTFHLCGGTDGDVTDGEKIVYTLADIGKELPGASLGGAKFEGWYDAESGGKKYTAVSSELPEELYARWSYNVLIDEWGDIEGDVTVTATVSGGTATITVAAKEPCVVIVQRGESYERLETDGENPDGSYSFEKEGFKADMVFWIAVLGDFDEDGDLDKADFTAANKAILNNEDVEPLQLLVMGANGKKLKTVDLAKLFLHLARNDVEW